ncbi:hypothetical protein N9L06_04615 [Mariniblastus sp.]|nr:hypothetical protein [Mariniblastus sp.]
MTKLFDQWVYISFGMAVLLGCISGDASGMQVELQAVTLSGTPARGAPSNVLVERIIGHNFGSTVFSKLSGPTVNVSNDHLLVDGGGDFTAREGGMARGVTDGGRYGEIDPNFASLDGTGGTAFRSTITGEGIDDVAIFLNFSQIGRTGEPAPETEPDTTFASFSSPHRNGRSRSVLVRVELAGPEIDGSNSQAIYELSDDDPQLVVRAGDQVPSTPDGVTFATFDAPTSHNGFKATVAGPGIDESNDEAVLLLTFSGVRLLAREGEGFGETNVLTAIGPISDSPGEGLAFRAVVSSGQQQRVVIFGDSSTRLSTIALSGRIAPDTSNDARFSDFSHPVVNSQGVVAYVASLDFGGGLIEEGVYRERQLSPDQLIMQTGEPVVGIGASVQVASFAAETLAIDAVAVVALLEGNGVNATNDRCLFARSSGGVMVPVVRTGDAIDVSRNSGIEDIRTIQGIQFDGSQSLQLSDSGVLTFELSFADGGNGIFTVDRRGPAGDFDFDGAVDADDIDLYAGSIGRSASVNIIGLDLNFDGAVSLADHDIFVTTRVQTSNGVTGALIGDINLDGSVNVLGDAFVLVANLGGVGPLGYAAGDLNADGLVTVLGDAFRLVSSLGLSNE